jgi:hypothetical protein
MHPQRCNCRSGNDDKYFAKTTNFSLSQRAKQVVCVSLALPATLFGPSPIKVFMSKRTFPTCLLSAFAILATVEARADTCPTAKDEIATDRPDVTNSSLVVPVGSLQSENGVNFSTRDGGRTIDGTNTRWRLGVAPCLELLLDLPTYFSNIRGPGSSGFSDVAPAIKWQVSPIRERSTCPWRSA